MKDHGNTTVGASRIAPQDAHIIQDGESIFTVSSQSLCSLQLASGLHLTTETNE
jgi:hypothetical protein